jgi:NADP-dependent 3-hydroxy acid dehydrogenase YdfG
MNKIACITGASAGFGQEIARKLSETGWNCIIIARREEKLLELKKELEDSYKNKVLVLALDVTDRRAVELSINNLPEEWQNIELLVNNAGLALGLETFDELSMDDIETMIDVNINGVIYLSKAIIPLMKKHKKSSKCQGHIINIGSVAGKNVYQNGSIYCMTKHAINALSHGQRIDLLKHKIKVTVINPGAAETEFSVVRFKNDAEKAKNVYKNYTPLYAKDIADATFYCASLPDNVCVDELTITSLSQADVHYIYREDI